MWVRVGRARRGAARRRLGMGACVVGACPDGPRERVHPSCCPARAVPVQLAKRPYSLRLRRIEPFLGVWPVLSPGKTDPLRHRLKDCLKVGRFLFGSFRFFSSFLLTSREFGPIL